MSKSPILFSSDDEDEESRQESELLNKFQLMLQGVPPPTSVTMSKLSASDILTKYKENESSFGTGCEQLDSTLKLNYKNNATPLVYYLNSSHISEEIANLSQKVQSRYIHSETLSSCIIWFDSAIKTNSSKKRQNCRTRLSPGSRLSHLARRRQIFSCENLQQLANSERRRHIEIKKQDALKNRNLDKNETVEFSKLNSSVRALFLSPDDDDNEKKVLLGSKSIKRNLFPSTEKRKVDDNKTYGVSTQPLQQSFVAGSSKKRKRTDSRDGNGNWPRRALTFTEEDSDKTQETRNAKVISELQLSLHHKSKLLWAVSVTLKEKNISSKHPQFKTCASALFMICRKNLGKILNLKVDGGTSEKMLHFARDQIDGIFKKLGISRDDEPTENGNLGFQNEASCLENTKECSDGCDGDAVYISDNADSFISESNSSELGQSERVQTSINEKENIDVSENDKCCV